MTPDAPDWQPAEADEMRDVERPARRPWPDPPEASELRDCGRYDATGKWVQ